MLRKHRQWSLPSAVVLSVLLASSVTVGQEVRDRQSPGVVPDSERSRIQPQYLPPGIQNPGPFKLGVFARNTQTGVQLTQVLPGSVAQRAGLEAGDTIVTVGGYQVGYVSGTLYDMGEELARRVDRQGRVTLLVRNHRDGRLLNLPIQFTAGLWTVSGNLYAKGTVGGSRTAALTVRLLDVTQPRWRDVTIAEVNLEVPARWPARYRLEVDPASIRTGHRYAVDARVTDRGQVVLQTAGPRRVELAGDGDRIDLTLMRTIDRPPGGGIVPYDQITP
jgi:putative lipoprotein